MNNTQIKIDTEEFKALLSVMNNAKTLVWYKDNKDMFDLTIDRLERTLTDYEKLQ